MSYMLGALVMASLMLAIKFRPPVNIERYLWAVLLEVPFLWAAREQWGDESWQYASIYALFTAPILVAIIGVTLDCLHDRAGRLRAIAIVAVIVSTVAHFAYLGMTGRYASISLVQGTVLLWCGTLTAFVSPHVRRSEVMFLLGFLWIFQAGWNLGWTVKGQEWEEWNWLIPPAIATIFFILLAWRLQVRIGLNLSEGR